VIAASVIWGSLAWAWPAVLLAAAAFAALLWGYGGGPVSPLVRSAGFALKALGIAALGVCLLEPLSSGTRPRPGANLFVVLADDSQSLTIRDSGASQGRAETLRRLLDDKAPWLVRLGQDFDVRKYRFAERLSRLENAGELAAAGTASALAGSLDTIARRFRDRPVAGVLLLSDGSATDLADAWLSGVSRSGLPPVYAAVLGSERPIKDVRVGQVAVSQTGFEEAPVTIRAEIEADGYQGRRLVVQLLDLAGKLLEQQTVTAAETAEPQVVRFRFRPEKPGVNFYELRAGAESELAQFDAPGRSLEATLANNTRLVTVDRPAGPYRVLYVSGRPNWEFKFLRRAVAGDDQVQLVALLRIAKREPKFSFLGRQGESTNPLYRGFGDQDKEEKEQYDQPVVVRLGTRDEIELRDGFPKKADLLYGYHAVILDDVEAAFFTADQLLLLEKFVSRRGGGLMMLGGAESLAEGGYRRTPIDQLLPVYLDAPKSPPAAGGYRLALTREGWLQPWVRRRQTEEEERGRLAAMPPFETLNRVANIKPGASVLAEVTDSAGNRCAALAAQRFGAGRTAALVLGDFWRWTLRRKPGEEDDLAKAWRQTIRWLVADVPQRVQLDVDRRKDRPGAPVEIVASVRDAEFEPMEGARVEFRVITPDGHEHALRGQAGGEEPGTYTAGYLPASRGAYRVTASVAAADGQSGGEAAAGWTEDPAAEEFRRLAPNAALLEQIAEQSGGEMIDPERLEEFVAGLPNRKIPVTERWVYPLWHQPLVLLFAMLCLTAEWGLRRYKGLP